MLRRLTLPSTLQQTALHWSAYYNNPEHAKLLIKHDSNIGIPDVEGKIPLHWAANHKDPSAVHTVRCILVSRAPKPFSQSFIFFLSQILLMYLFTHLPT